MAVSEHRRRFQDLTLDTSPKELSRQSSYTNETEQNGKKDELARIRSVDLSQETIKPTPPIRIQRVKPTEEAIASSSSSSSDRSSTGDSSQPRKTSISFNNEVLLESGHRQSMAEPLLKPVKTRSRGRSLLQAISDERSKTARTHSESEKTHFDPVTGRLLSRFSTSPPRDEAHVGEGRFPLLQSTVDDLARESHTDLSSTMSMTSQSTISPSSEDVRTPRDERLDFVTSPSAVSPPLLSSSYDPGPVKRTASQRWRDGEVASDFFSRAGSLRKGLRQVENQSSRRSTGGSTKSPRSAASSFLRGFSLNSRGDGADVPTACDAEGQTIGDDYVIGRQIGFGGFSVIKEVTHMHESGGQRRLAAKIVRRTIDGKSEVENEQAQAEFEHEVELWRFLSHPRILPLEAVYKTDQATFCLIPLNEGGTLFDLVRANRQGLAPELAKRHSYYLASALRYLHCDARVVHRDIKLENCLVDTSRGPPGDVRLCDFGMAEWLANDESSGPSSPAAHSADRQPYKYIGPADTSTSAFAGGSLEYAAPEILRVATTDGIVRPTVSAAVDVWAYGVCVYSMLVGSRPFSNSFQPRVVMAILAGEWDRQKLLDKAGQDAFDLVEGCLAMDEAERFDITDVLNSKWLREMADSEEGHLNGASGSGWRL